MASTRRTRPFAALFLAGIALLAGCSALSPNEGQCGGGQYAESHVVLPDTGFNAGTQLKVVFIQHDTLELTELAVWHLWPSGNTIDPEPDPRVRLVRTDGRVLLDTLGSRVDMVTGQPSYRTWYVFRWIRSADVRNALYEALRDEALWVELGRPGVAQPMTRVRLHSDEASVREILICL